MEETKTNGKYYYSIGEVAAMFNVNTSMIRYWEKEFDVLRPRKNKKGNRLFTERDVRYVHVIYQLLKVKGYTLAGAKAALRIVSAITRNALSCSKPSTRLETFCWTSTRLWRRSRNKRCYLEKGNCPWTNRNTTLARPLRRC